MRTNSRKTLSLLAALFLATTVATTTSLAWSAGGHRIVALIAWEQMQQEDRQRVVRILRAHPQFDRHFQPPDSLPSRDHDKWLFTQAAVWADIVRGDDDFHRSTWHYVNFPMFLNRADESALGDGLQINLKSQPPTDANLATPGLNIVQALRLCREVMGDDEAPDADKAVAVCWIFHLVGDSHQPCHSTALFSRAVLKDGDRGGNRIPVNDVQRRTAEIMGDEEVIDRAKQASEELDEDVWVKESHDMAKALAYHRNILSAVRAAEASGEELERIQLPRSYYTQIGEAATLRVATAGCRLAEVLEKAEF